MVAVAAWRKARFDANQAWIAECDHCDEAGWLQDDPEDGLPAMKCPHAPNWLAWWQLQQQTTTDQPRAS
ncbi:hypothetical protein AWC03_02825 [Mycobacterium europaeum]|nr:hypothetical protein AWC03_02825 [Mycobacterium europaeum]